MENKVFLIYYFDKSYDVVVSDTIDSALDKVRDNVIKKGVAKCECIPNKVIM